MSVELAQLRANFDSSVKIQFSSPTKGIANLEIK